MAGGEVGTVKLVEARRKEKEPVRRKEKEPAVVLEVDISSDSEPLVGKCSQCFNGNGKTCHSWMHTSFKCGQVRGSSSNPGEVSSNHGLLI